MVVGNGLIATIFRQFQEEKRVTVFASGVSNSLETSEAEFARELDLVRKHISPESTFVYFSTISVFDKSLEESHYIRHKLDVERLIAASCERFIIIRLPNVVGRSTNPYTLTNHLFDRIRQNLPVEIHRYASRHLIDADDVGSFVSRLIRSEKTLNSATNVCLDNKMGISDLVDIFEEVLGKKAVRILADKGADYDVDNTTFLSFLSEVEYSGSKRYNHDLIKKYYSGRL
ncbi:MAG: NAD-dependent epimerase/dehydratase family protein [Bacteroidota bacterium]